MNRLRSALLCVLTLIMFPTLSWAWQGKVVGISDGDTISVLHEGKAEKIRVYGVDCPESHQDFGQKAKQFTSSMVFGKVVEIQPKDTDRHGRTVGLVTLDGKSLNEALVKAGMAWVYVKYCKEPFCTQWNQSQEEARSKRIGLWSIPNPTPPWEFRHPKSGASSESKSKSVQGPVIYHGNTSLMVLHRPGCRGYDCQNRTAVFKTREAAVAAGYWACGMCKP